jgi:hypothetical protein
MSFPSTHQEQRASIRDPALVPHAARRVPQAVTLADQPVVLLVGLPEHAAAEDAGHPVPRHDLTIGFMDRLL